jgi:hypothetical protein
MFVDASCGKRPVTVFLGFACFDPPVVVRRKIDRSLAIVVEAEQNSNRANFPLKSKAENFDGSMVGFRPSEERFYAYKSICYDALRESSGRDSGVAPDNLEYHRVLRSSLLFQLTSIDLDRWTMTLSRCGQSAAAHSAAGATSARYLRHR